LSSAAELSLSAAVEVFKAAGSPSASVTVGEASEPGVELPAAAAAAPLDTTPVSGPGLGETLRSRLGVVLGGVALALAGSEGPRELETEATAGAGRPGAARGGGLTGAVGATAVGGGGGAGGGGAFLQQVATNAASSCALAVDEHLRALHWKPAVMDPVR
jgi:hypothetical protein